MHQLLNQAELNKKAEMSEVKARAAREKAIKAAESAGVEPPDLEPLAVEAMPRRGLARKADGTPTKKTQRNFTTQAATSCSQAGPICRATTARWLSTATTR